ncbi:hypothetical protein ACFLZA_02595 [Candidatus Neomarinimicrobiota bacterium]
MKILSMISLLVLLTSIVFSQSVEIKDGESNVLTQFNDEGTAGSITLLDAISVKTPTNKLYNEGGSLKWNGNILGSGGSSLWTLGTSGLIYYDGGNVAINRPSTETPLGVHATILVISVTLAKDQLY